MNIKRNLSVAAETLVAILSVAALVVACGGGGGSSAGGTPAANTLGGVAAVGTPIVGATVNFVCAAGSAVAPTTTTGTGSWQVGLSGQTLPCAIELSGGTISGVPNTTPYHAIAIASGTVNLTPLTDLVVANLAGTATPSAWFAGLSSSPATLAAITQTKMNAALTNLSTLLSGLTPLSTNNPITTTFTPSAGNVSDNMLTALATAMTNTGVSYVSLLSSASTNSAPVSGFNTVLTATYAGMANGSGTGSSPPTPGLSSYIADQQGTSFTGGWNIWFPSTVAASAFATTNTLAATSTANIYAGTNTFLQLVNGAWGATASTSYDLIPTGWFLTPNTGTLTDSGDGTNYTFAPTGEPASGYSVTKTSLAGTPIACFSPTTGTNVACAIPGNYPTGAVTYDITQKQDSYSLAGGAGSGAVTDANGLPLIALPVLNTTFCDPTDWPATWPANVYVPIAGAATGANNYNVYNLVGGSCTTANISASISASTAVPYATVLISKKATGSTAVPNVLILTNPVPLVGVDVSWITNWIYGVRAGNVWDGSMNFAGLVNTIENKTAIDAELKASGLNPL